MNNTELQNKIKAKFAANGNFFDTEFIEVKAEPKKEPKPENLPTIKNDKANQLLSLLNEIVKPDSTPIDEEFIKQIVKDELTKQEPKRIEIKYNDLTTNIEGQVHKQLEQVLKVAANRLHIWLTGTAGAGKTKTAEQVAQALNLPFYCVSVCAQTTESKLLGYNDANGKYSTTIFYDAYKNGGVFLLDEIDNANPNVLSVLNSALANGVCAFACGMVEKHPDFICIAAANTIGTGGNLQYVGRNRIDAATLDRFIFINFQVDEVLEMNLSANKEFTKIVQGLREKANTKGLNVIISPRASINGGKLINAGFTTDEALNMVLFNKLTNAEINALKN